MELYEVWVGTNTGQFRLLVHTTNYGTAETVAMDYARHCDMETPFIERVTCILGDYVENIT